MLQYVFQDLANLHYTLDALRIYSMKHVRHDTFKWVHAYGLEDYVANSFKSV